MSSAPAPPPVRPRVRHARTSVGLPALLEEVVAQLLDEHAAGAVRLGGGAGAGKTAALAALAAKAGWAERIATLDEPTRDEVLRALPGRLVIYASDAPVALAHLAEYDLAPWDEDDRLEYVLARHPEHAASVIARVASSGPAVGELAGSPELWAPVLDALAASEALPDVDAALREVLRRSLTDAPRAALLGRVSLLELLGRRDVAAAVREDMGERFDPGADERLARHRAVQCRLAAGQVIDDLGSGKTLSYLEIPFAPDLLRATGRRLASDVPACSSLERLIEEGGSFTATAASLLHAADCGWVARHLARCARESRPLPDLSWADLRGAHAAGVIAPELVLDRADCAGGDWSGARLERMSAQEAGFGGCRLRGATLDGCHASGAYFGGADLRDVSAENAWLNEASLREAKLEGARLTGAYLPSVEAEGARFRGADLSGAQLAGAHLDGADLRGASLARASLGRVDLRHVRLEGADLTEAFLERAHLEGLVLPQARLEGVRAAGALFTSSAMPGADLRRADLRNTGLAEVEWEGADLRGADLSGASFHLGSTRSGKLAGYPSEGTRTGFYTDDFDDQHHKAPEEIRKANLVGADLREARVEDVDFYLVDLRGVQCSAQQREHFRRCGAILERRA